MAAADAGGLATAMVWEGGTSFHAASLPLPDLAEGEVLVQLEAATICGSDRHTVSGRRQEACPSILGHEGVGRVQDSRRAGLGVGERVVFSVTSSCRECARCERGLTSKCESVRKVGHEGLDGSWPLSGTYASHILLRAGQAIAAVPEEIPDAVASTAGCAVATVMAMRERAGRLRGRRVLVSGAGMLGIIALAAARSAGASHLTASDPDAGARMLATELADEVIDPSGAGSSAGGPSAADPPATGPDQPRVDIAFELSGVHAGVVACLDALDIGGTAVLAGTVAPVPDVPVDPERLVRGWRTVTGVHNYEPRHLYEAVEFLAADGKNLPWDRLLGPPINLTDLASAFDRPDGAYRTPVRF